MQTVDTSEWSLTHPFIYALFGLVVFPFLLAQYAYFALVSANKEPKIAEGLAKLFQCYALIVGSALALMGVSFALFYGSRRAEKAGLVPLDSVTSFLAACITLYALLVLINGPQDVLSKLYKLSARVAFGGVLIGCAAAMAGMFIGHALFGFSGGSPLNLGLSPGCTRV